MFTLVDRNTSLLLSTLEVDVDVDVWTWMSTWTWFWTWTRRRRRGEQPQGSCARIFEWWVGPRIRLQNGKYPFRGHLSRGIVDGTISCSLRCLLEITHITLITSKKNLKRKTEKELTVNLKKKNRKKKRHPRPHRKAPQPPITLAWLYR